MEFFVADGGKAGFLAGRLLVEEEAAVEHSVGAREDIGGDLVADPAAVLDGAGHGAEEEALAVFGAHGAFVAGEEFATAQRLRVHLRLRLLRLCLLRLCLLRLSPSRPYRHLGVRNRFGSAFRCPSSVVWVRAVVSHRALAPFAR